MKENVNMYLKISSQNYLDILYSISSSPIFTCRRLGIWWKC